MLTSQRNVQGLKSEILKSLGTKDSKSNNQEAKRNKKNSNHPIFCYPALVVLGGPLRNTIQD